MKITQAQPCILWKTTPVANPLHKPAHTLKHSQTPPMPTFHPLANVSIALKSHTNITPTPCQHRARTSPAHDRAKPSKITSHGQKSAPIAAKTNETTPPYAHERTELVQIANRTQKRASTTSETNETTPPYAHNRTKTGEIANHEQKGVSTVGENGKIIYPFAHERTKSARIASREQKGVSIEVENDENMHPFAHRRAKSNEIATREQEAAQTGQPETATLSGKSNPNGVATATKCGRSSRKPRAPTPQTTAHTRNRCHAAQAVHARSHADFRAAHLR